MVQSIIVNRFFYKSIIWHIKCVNFCPIVVINDWYLQFFTMPLLKIHIYHLEYMPLCSAVARRINLPYNNRRIFIREKKTCFCNIRVLSLLHKFIVCCGRFGHNIFDFVYTFWTCCPARHNRFNFFVFSFASADIISSRNYSQGNNWKYFSKGLLRLHK